MGWCPCLEELANQQVTAVKYPYRAGPFSTCLRPMLLCRAYWMGREPMSGRHLQGIALMHGDQRRILPWREGNQRRSSHDVLYSGPRMLGRKAKPYSWYLIVARKLVSKAWPLLTVTGRAQWFAYLAWKPEDWRLLLVPKFCGYEKAEICRIRRYLRLLPSISSQLM